MREAPVRSDTRLNGRGGSSEAVNFFYPSTEWEMEQAFEFGCAVKTCLGRIQGAKFLTRDEVAARGWVSPWIEELM
ncbi:hypothetical protein B0H17DRAFT_1056361, partial [Mycena rosella]